MSVTPRDDHRAREQSFAAVADANESTANRLQAVRLALFSLGVLSTGIGLSRARFDALLGGGTAFVLFGVAVVVHALVLGRRDRARTRAQVHARHVARMAGVLAGCPDGAGLLPAEHPYASDLDLVGPGSLFQRIAVHHTRHGGETLARWLGGPAELDTVRARQEAVRELAGQVELRQELEASALDTGAEPLDAGGFLDLARRPPMVHGNAAMRVLRTALPTVTLTTFALSDGWLPEGAWVLPVALQAFVVWRTGGAVAERYALLSARRRTVESYAALLRVIETAQWTAPHLRALQAELRIEGRGASAELARLGRWASLFDLRMQGIVHVFVDLFTLWDLHCLAGVERWMEETGTHCEAWFRAVGEVEALASLATLLHQDDGVVMPEVTAPGTSLVAEGLAHPLIPQADRVRNDVRLAGSGTALVVTGSNMAGKSTLLRAVGLDVALALAGGPVCATRFSTPVLRLRASMRVADSIQSKASYFQAELRRLRTVIEAAEQGPPILFLLDELLRGTNARARHKGAMAVVRHLLRRGALGLVATHDIALSELESELPGKVGNAHFTDVVEHGEMVFDYRLRPGVVRTSNALRLLQQAGIDVDADDALDLAAPGPTTP